MAQWSRRVPSPTEYSAPYWRSGLEMRGLRLLRCGSCGKWTPYVKRHCPYCGQESLQWQTVPGEGVLYSYSVHYRPAAPEFQDQVPYVIGLVQLDHGPRLLSRILGDPDEMAVGRRVRAVFEQVENDWAIPFFEVVKG